MHGKSQVMQAGDLKEFSESAKRMSSGNEFHRTGPIAFVRIRAEVTTQAHYVISKSNCL